MIDIVQGVIEAKAKKIEQWPVKSNRASQMGHPCERFLVYERTHWQEKALHDVGLQFVFDEGRVHEKAVLRDLEDAGFQIIEQQKAFSWDRYQITGHTDGKIIDDGTAIPFEIKSMSDWAWRATNSIEDMFKSKAHYMKMYPGQLMLYELMDDKEIGFFILKNKTSGFLKQINVPLDFEYAESLIQKAERINRHVDDGTLPDRIPYEDNICGQCAYEHICLPDAMRQQTLLVDSEFELKLDRRARLKETKDEYEEIDKEIREAVREKPEVICGNWKITGKWIEKKEYTVPVNMYWQTQITKLKK